MRARPEENFHPVQLNPEKLSLPRPINPPNNSPLTSTTKPYTLILLLDSQNKIVQPFLQGRVGHSPEAGCTKVKIWKHQIVNLYPSPRIELTIIVSQYLLLISH